MKEKQTPTLSDYVDSDHIADMTNEDLWRAVFSPSMELLSVESNTAKKKKKKLPYRAQKVNLSPH